MRRLRQAVMAGGVAVIVSAPAWSFPGDCSTRHFYNHSTNAKVYMVMAGGAACSERGRKNDFSCLIGPGEVAELHWPHGGAGMTFNDSLNNRRWYVYKDGGDCLLHHDSDTGFFAINDPADGDVNRYMPH